jgi:branched-chain amino acid transport system permease protein
MSWVQSLIDAIGLGAVYALVAVGIALVFGVMRLINFAHGELITAAAYTLALTDELPRAVSVVLCFAVAIVLAVLMERLAFRPLRGASPATTLVATFAVAFVLQAVWLIAFGPQGESADLLGRLNRAITIGEIHIRWITITMIAVGGALLGGTALLLNRTDVGLQMRAAAADFRTARLLGVRADTVISLAFVIAGVMAGAVAVLLTVSRPLVQPDFGLDVVILGLVGVVVGGVDRLVPATLGGFAIGFATSILGDALPSGNRVFLDSFVFALVIAVLLVRPAGLFAPLRAATVERV